MDPLYKMNQIEKDEALGLLEQINDCQKEFSKMIIDDRFCMEMTIIISAMEESIKKLNNIVIGKKRKTLLEQMINSF